MRPPSGAAILALLDGPPLPDAEAVRDRLTAVLHMLDSDYPDDAPPSAIHAFTFLYLDITTNIVEWLAADKFVNGHGLNRLDVNFYNRYQAALAAYLSDGEASRCWIRQFDCDTPRDHLAERPGAHYVPSRLQMAAAGVNAHVNCDLSQAVVRTWHELGIDEQDEDFAADFTRVNRIFFARIPELVAVYEREDPLHGVELLGRGAEHDEDEAVVGCRALAWQAARWLWRRRIDNTPQQTQPLLDLSASKLCDLIVSRGVSDAIFGPSPHPNALADRAGYDALPADPAGAAPDLDCPADAVRR